MPKPPPKQGSNRTGIKSGPDVEKTGPKPIPIDWEKLGILASLYATQAEIAAFAACSVATLDRRYELEHDGETFGEFVLRNRDKGKAKLRTLQMKSAEAGSVPMQIWLGKNLLGQSDKIEHYAMPEPTIIKRLNGAEYELGAKMSDEQIEDI